MLSYLFVLLVPIAQPYDYEIPYNGRENILESHHGNKNKFNIKSIRLFIVIDYPHYLFNRLGGYTICMEGGNA